MIDSFKDLALNDALKKALEELGFTKPTEIQAKAIPQLLEAKNIDFHGQAQTGTGKTLAFGLPMLNNLDPKSKHVQALIVAPTRELVVQIYESLEKVSKHMAVTITPIYGGMSMSDQVRILRRGVQVIVGTPGRLNDHIRRKTLDLSQVRTLVLDEADIMLEMGFKEEIDEILNSCPKDRSIWLFSATVKGGIEAIKRSHMKNPISVSVSKSEVSNKQVQQYYCMVPTRQRIAAVARFIDKAPDFYGLIFCPTKVLTGEVAEILLKRGYKVAALHGDMNQAARNKVIKRFKDKQIDILVATDVAARGIDVAGLTHVINYGIPLDQESYVHRVGRTGRAGKEGIAITFINPSEVSKIKRLQQRFHFVINPIEVPSIEDIAATRIADAAEYMALASHKSKHDASYIEELKKLASEYDHAALVNVAVHCLYDLFFKHIKEADIDFTQSSYERSPRERGESRLESGHEELLLTVGLDDGITKSDLLAFLEKYAKLKPHQLGKIKLIKRQSFISVPSKEISRVIREIDRKQLAGREVRVRRV